MGDCRFCRIIRREDLSYVVYEDDEIIAFLSNMPINPGHVLVVPKVHEPEFYKLDDEIYQSLMKTVKKVAVAISEIYKPVKVGELIAGWDIPHTHVHVLPMYDYDDITSKKVLDGKLESAPETALSIEAEKIKTKI